jgi:hypothetical protein
MLQSTNRRNLVAVRISLSILGALIAASQAGYAAPIPAPEEVRSDTISAVNIMRNGTTAVVVPDDPGQTKKNREAIAKLARFLAYRIAQPPYNGEPVNHKDDKNKPKPETETMQYLMDEAERMGINLTNVGLANVLTPNHYSYANEFGKEMQTELTWVFEQSSKNIEKLNAIRMMSLAAKLPYPGFAQSFMKILKNDNLSYAYHLYAFQGLRNVLSHSAPQNDPSKPAQHILPQNELVEIAKLLEAKILAGRTYTLTGAPGEAENIQVIQFIRRYAIQALGQFKDSIIRDKQKNVLAKPGYPLIIAAAPPEDPKKLGYSYPERIDAIIGFCNMRPDELLNLEAAAWWINEGLIDIVNYEAEEQGLINKVGGRPRIAWKVTAARLIEALNAWKKNMQGVKTTWQPQAVVSYVEKAVPVLEPIEKDGLKASVLARNLTTWRESRQPKDRTVFLEPKKDE